MGQVRVDQEGPDQEQRDSGGQGGDAEGDESSGDAGDEVLSFHSDMLFSGVIQLAQKAATQHGACQALTSFWKNSLVTYHENGKNKYRKATHMKIAAAAGVLGEKIMIDSTFNSLVNDQGIHFCLNKNIFINSWGSYLV